MKMYPQVFTVYINLVSSILDLNDLWMNFIRHLEIID